MRRTLVENFMSENGKTTLELLKNSAGGFKLRGEMNFDTVPAVFAQSKVLFAADESVDIDLAEVSAANSAGLGLLLEWLKQAHKTGRAVRLHNIPSGIMAIAKTCDLDGLLNTR
jgi:phospholipid transport system transporter-binding protein